MRDVLSWAGAAEGSVVFATGLVNAGYFAARARSKRPARRFAAVLLSLLYLGTAALAAELLLGELSDGPVVALRAPLVLGNVLTLLLIVIGVLR